MKVTKQSNPNECGVCVINSLLHYFYRFDDKQAVLDYAQLHHQGLSLFEFESTCCHFRLSALSYELTFNEFKHLKLNGYFVLLLNRLDANHYVIGKKHHNGVEIFDSSLGKYFLTYDELEKVFVGILIKVKKLKKFKVNFQKHNFNFCFNPMVLLISLLLQGISAGLSVGFGFFMNAIIDLATNNEAFKTLIFLTFMFMLISVMKNTTNYILTRFNLQYVYDYYLIHKNHLIKVLMNKKNSFSLKVDHNYFYILNHVIYEISGFYLHTVTNFINSILVSLVICILVSILNPSFLIIIGINLVLEIFVNWIIFHHQDHLYDQTLIKTNNSNQICRNYLTYQNQGHNCLTYNFLANEINQSFNCLTDLQNKQSVFNAKLGWFQSIFTDLIYLGTIFIGSILIQKQTGMSIGQLLFFASTIIYFNSHLSELIGFGLKLMMNNKLTKIYLDYTKVDNLNDSSNVVINKKINCIKVVKNKQHDNLKDLKENLRFYADLITNKVSSKETKIFINNVNAINLNQEWLNQHVCYLNGFDDLIVKDINQELITANQFNRKLLAKTQDYEHQNIKKMLYTLMYLTSQTNLIIIFDRFFEVFSKKDQIEFQKELIPYLASKHYLVAN